VNFNTLVQLVEAINPYSDLTPEQAYFKAAEENKRIPELEEIILRSPFYTASYAIDVLKGRWPEGEKALLENDDMDALLEYAMTLGERWLEAEEIFKTEPHFWDQYVDYINSLSSDNDIPEEL